MTNKNLKEELKVLHIDNIVKKCNGWEIQILEHFLERLSWGFFERVWKDESFDLEEWTIVEKGCWDVDVSQEIRFEMGWR